MNKVDREKFYDLQTNDSIVYLDDEGVRCNAVVTGWKNYQGDPAVLVGERGETPIPLAMIISRSRNGNTKKWSEQV